MIYPLRGENVTVQTFRDHGRATGFPDIRSGTLEGLRAWFLDENRKGMGVFYSVNPMQPGHRGRAHILDVHTYYVDIDGLKNPVEKDYVSEALLASELAPTVIVYTKNGVQALWRVHNAPNDSERYKQTELGIIERFGGDRNAKDIARVLRMPGTFHMKAPDDPYMVTVMYQEDDALYSEADVRSAFPPPFVERFPRGNTSYLTQRVSTPGEWGEIVHEYAQWRGNPGSRHDTLLIAAGNAVRCCVPETQAVQDLLPIVERWRAGSHLALTETQNAVSFAYRQGIPYARKALQNRLT